MSVVGSQNEKNLKWLHLRMVAGAQVPVLTEELTCDGPASLPGGVVLVTEYYRNQDKLQH
jgi:hypothetical protein